MGIGKFFGGFAKVLKTPIMQDLAPAIVNGYLPGVWPLVQYATHLITSAEDKFGPKSGAEKMADVTGKLSIAAPLIVAMIEQTSGRELADEAKLQEGLRDLAEAQVKIMNAFGLLPKGA